MANAYSELYFTKTLWPDFNTSRYSLALRNYVSRKRRFEGLTCITNIEDNFKLFLIFFLFDSRRNKTIVCFINIFFDFNGIWEFLRLSSFRLIQNNLFEKTNFFLTRQKIDFLIM